MKLNRIAVALLCALGVQALQAGDLSPEQTAKFLKVIANSSGNKVSCQDGPLKAALTALGVGVESGSPVVWCTGMGEAKMQKQMGKLVVVGHKDLMSVACVVLEEEDGHPKILLNTGNIRACHVTLGDALMKIGEKL